MLTWLILTSVFPGLQLFELYPVPLKPTDLNNVYLDFPPSVPTLAS